MISNQLTRTQKIIKLHLAKLAAISKIIPYAEFCRKISLPYSMDNPYHRNLLSEDLGEVAKEEVEYYERPMLSCMLVEKQSNLPAKGFFDWAEVLYKIKIKEKQRLEFFIDQLKSSIAFWSSPEGKQEIIRLENELMNSKRWN